MCWQCETRDDDIAEHLDQIRDAVRQHIGETKTGGPLRPGAHLDFLGVAAIEIVEVDQPDAHLGLAVALFGPDVRAVQLVWTDLSGHWPWESTFDDELPQPVLGVRAEAA